MRGSSPKLDHCGGGGPSNRTGTQSSLVVVAHAVVTHQICGSSAAAIQLVGEGVAYLLLSYLEGRETIVNVLVETELIIAHQRWWMMMVM
jgi:hypothetical protein